MESLDKILESQVDIPGYNIRPKYDLGATRKYLEESRRRPIGQTLPLTSMIDMFSMVVIFLILNFSATGDAFFVSRGVVLPTAHNADLMKSFPLVSILEDRIYLDAIPADHPQLELEERTQPYPRLRSLLKKLLAQKIRENPGEKPSMTVNVQADEKTPMVRVKEVMNMLIEEGWTGIQLTVKKRSDKNS